MILTVTINPLLERRLFFDRINPEGENRAEKEQYVAGGKGINISRQLNVLGIKNIALTFLGGPTSKILRQTLAAEGINYTAVAIRDDMRTATAIFDGEGKRRVSYFSPNFEVTEKEVNEFKSKLAKMIPNASLVVFAGSSPSPLADEIFPFGIETAEKEDKPVLLDTYGAHLEECLKRKPFALHNNLSEIKKSLNVDLNDEEAINEFLMKLYAKGVRLSFLTNGADYVRAAKFDFHYRAKPPQIKEIDAVGSGDAFTAGIIYGLEKSLVFKDSLKFAAALGALNAADIKTCAAPKEEAEKSAEKICVEEIGKKMKIIDDSPNY
ncbi:MAG: 1-phosphofructokinase [Chlorobi bacterium]|nr:1-phosphofructokinase [Chlorobiota bacterium]